MIDYSNLHKPHFRSWKLAILLGVFFIPLAAICGVWAYNAWLWHYRTTFWASDVQKDLFGREVVGVEALIGAEFLTSPPLPDRYFEWRYTFDPTVAGLEGYCDRPSPPSCTFAIRRQLDSDWEISASYEDGVLTIAESVI